MKSFSFYISLLMISAGSLIFSACQLQQASQPLSLLPLFGDHMVLQQETEVSIWGNYTPEAKVTVMGSWGEEVKTKADQQGKWQLLLPTPKAGGPYELRIETTDSTLTLSDVIIGEVWLASGQSNMEMPLKGWPPNDTILHSAKEIAQADHPGIRMFTVNRNLGLSPLNDMTGEWQVTSPEVAEDFSATAYSFARKLHAELNVPIGIIHSSWGGTPAEAWTSREKLLPLGDFDEMLGLMGDPDAQQKSEAWFGQWETLPYPETVDGWAGIDLGDAAVSSSSFDDKDWPEVLLPGRFDVFKIGEIDGVFWLRKKVQITDISSDYTLHIGAVDDMDNTYVNGQRVGAMVGGGMWNKARSYRIPKSILVQGENTITIRAIDTGGGGSVSGPIEMINVTGESISLIGNWQYKVVAESRQNLFHVYGLKSPGFEKRPQIFQLQANAPSSLFNAMIHPLIPYSIKGAIWYQGEANVGRAVQYQKLFPVMIEDWRSRWGDEFPFYFAQIAPFQYNGNPDPSTDVSQELRDAQRLSLATPKTGMAVTMDIGNFTNIHPGNKQDVGKRLAAWALAKDYGKDIIPSGPLYNSMEQAEDHLVLSFDYVGGGLVAGPDGLTGFEIAGADGKFVPADARIVGDQVQLSAAGIATPQHARYAWRDYGVATLFNQAGLPASGFRTR